MPVTPFRFVFATIAVLLAMIRPSPVQAVILEATEDRNITAPTGALLDSGWQYQGQWGSFLGTPIASQYFVTAKHVGGSVGQSFALDSMNYTTTAKFDDPSSDLTIWKVGTTFPSNRIAPLYTANTEANKELIVFGRGTQRGTEVNVSNVLKGWQWGPSDGVQSWGQNVVSGTFNSGSLLGFTFTRGVGAVANEGALSVGDSGGGVFIKDVDDVWKLAGINFAVDGPFSFTGTDVNMDMVINQNDGFNASLFDRGGLHQWNGGFTLINDTIQNDPSRSFATRISARQNWINSTVPEPSTFALALVAGLLGLCSVRRRSMRR